MRKKYNDDKLKLADGETSWILYSIDFNENDLQHQKNRRFSSPMIFQVLDI